MNNKRVVSQMVSLTVVLMFSAACVTSQPTPTVSPTAIAGLGPSSRGYTPMAYDAESERVILFGGQTGGVSNPASFNGETWAYDVAAGKWTEMKPASGPGNRSAAELTYDAESDRVILYGGANTVKEWFDDTWAYDYNTNTWTEMAKGPPDHLGARIAYDAESDRTILFGGYSGSFYNDTWAYDLNSDTWKEMKPSTSPPGRNFQAMAYDARSDRMIMFGGLYEYRDSIEDNVWSYDLNTNTWQEMKPGGGPLPSTRDYAAMAYDAESGRMILYGGSPKGGDETWAYDHSANTWTKLEPSTIPGKLSRHAMVYSTAAERVILFGGQVGLVNFQYTEKTWTYDLNTNTWANVTLHP